MFLKNHTILAGCTRFKLRTLSSHLKAKYSYLLWSSLPNLHPLMFYFFEVVKIWVSWKCFETFHFLFWAMTYWKFSLTLEACIFQTWTCFFNWQFFAALKVISTFLGRCRNGQFQKNVALPEGTSFTLFHHIYVMQKSNSWKVHKSNKYFCAFFCKYYTHLMHLRSIIDQCTRSLAYKVEHFFSFIIWKKIFSPQMTNTDL